MSSNVINFEVCGFIISILERKYIFSTNKKLHSLDIKGYIMAKNNLLVEVTFKVCLSEAERIMYLMVE